MNSPLTHANEELDTAQIVERNACFYVVYRGKSYGSFPTRIGAESWWEAQKQDIAHE